MLPLQQFTDYIKKNALFLPHHKVLLAVSGGKDSVLMAQLFKLSGYQFSIAHCNFNLRGSESQRDEAFVRLLSAELDVPFYVAHFDTEAYASDNRLSVQMAAREMRYQWFEQLRIEGDYTYIALAHHQTDSVETLLLNLTRGTGISGLHGILPKRGRLIRPLLFLSRPEIDRIVDENGLSFITDSSNASAKYARNSIRLHVLPYLREINPNLEETFARSISLFAQTEEILQQFVAQQRHLLAVETNGMTCFPIDALLSSKPQPLLLFELLKPFGFSYPVVQEIFGGLKKQSGTSYYSHSHRATVDRSNLVISPSDDQGAAGIRFFHSDDELVHIGHETISMVYASPQSITFEPHRAYVDAERLIFPLVVRYRQDGDRFMPLGMGNFKKLSDFLIGQKIPLPQKDHIPLLINGNGEMIWVAGLRQDNRYKVNATTKKVAIFELLNH